VAMTKFTKSLGSIYPDSNIPVKIREKEYEKKKTMRKRKQRIMARRLVGPSFFPTTARR
jgi:hypothetical protein